MLPPSSGYSQAPSPPKLLPSWCFSDEELRHPLEDDLFICGILYAPFLHFWTWLILQPTTNVHVYCLKVSICQITSFMAIRVCFTPPNKATFLNVLCAWILLNDVANALQVLWCWPQLNSLERTFISCLQKGKYLLYSSTANFNHK